MGVGFSQFGNWQGADLLQGHKRVVPLGTEAATLPDVPRRIGKDGVVTGVRQRDVSSDEIELSDARISSIVASLKYS